MVFDCSSEFQRRSLNKELISGPDLTNQIVGVLSRSRENEIALMIDIEYMFYQVRVSEEHRRFLKFLWWKDGKYENPVIDCEMNVHVFRATSSPGCSNYALKKTSLDYKEVCGSKASETLDRNLYVDDMLKSAKSEEEAVELVKDVKLTCKFGGFHLTMFLTNSKKVLEAVPACDRRKSVVECNFSNQSLPTETALGVLWNIEEDAFTFNVNMKEKPKARRAMLSTLSSVHDPLGFVAPFILQGSEEGYGQVTYLRTVDENNRIFCNIVMAKSRVTPLKFVSLPRLELTAATLAVKVATHLKQELDIKIDEEMFWTDSRVVLTYIQNTKRRFKMFVANRIYRIKSNSDVSQWHYIQTNENLADDCSRGLEMKSTAE